MPTPRARIESRIHDIGEALREARSGDVRELLREMLDEQRSRLAELEGKAAERRPEKGKATRHGGETRQVLGTSASASRSPQGTL